MSVRQELCDILMLELPDPNPWEGEIRKLIERLIAHGVTVQKWISVKERLPKYGVPVLAADSRDGFVRELCLEKYAGDKVFWVSEGHWCLNTDEVTHWMPLPEPPKEVTE